MADSEIQRRGRASARSTDTNQTEDTASQARSPASGTSPAEPTVSADPGGNLETHRRSRAPNEAPPVERAVLPQSTSGGFEWTMQVDRGWEEERQVPLQ